jgi:FkbM family methyltransferase
VTLALQADNSLFRFLLGTRYVRVAARKIIPEYVTTVPGGIRLRVRSGDSSESYMIDEIYHKKVYEKFYEAKAGDVVLDVGANIGAFSVKISGLVGEGGRIVAVEPESTNFRLLRSNIEMNDCKNILPVRTALGEHPGKASLNVYKKRGNNSFLAKKTESLERQEEVGVRTLDDLLEECALSRLSLIKVDTEGYELKVLEGGSETIRRLKPRIVGEAHPHVSDSASVILRYLGEFGYDGTIFTQIPGYEEIFYAWPRDYPDSQKCPNKG